MSDKIPILIVITPVPNVERVAIQEHTWTEHILPRNRTESPEEHTVLTLGSPTAVCIGTSNPDYLCYINHGVLSQNSGSPFVAVVDPNAKPLPELRSIGFRRDFKDLSPHTIVWTPK